MPIRYVSAVILIVAIFGLASAGIDQVATTNSQEHIDSEVAELEDSAVSLYENEEVPPAGLEGSQRYVAIELPDDDLITDPIEYLRIRQTNENTTVVEYQFEGGAVHQRHLDVRIIPDNSRSLRVTGAGTTYKFLLTLERDEEGKPVVRLSRET
jgi:hypothetical protein